MVIHKYKAGTIMYNPASIRRSTDRELFVMVIMRKLNHLLQKYDPSEHSGKITAVVAEDFSHNAYIEFKEMKKIRVHELTKKILKKEKETKKCL